MLSQEKYKISKPELVALLLYVPGASDKTGEGIVGKTRIMKLMFLLLKEMGLEENIIEEPSFEPYKYGPFDAEVYDALDALEDLNVIEETPHPSPKEEGTDDEMVEQYDANTTYRLTDFGLTRTQELAKNIPKNLMDKIIKVKIIYGKMPLIELLHYVYGKYPEFARLSEANI
jgi:hypothetical protein